MVLNKHLSWINGMCEILLIEEPDLTIKYVNQAFSDTYGITPVRANGRKILDFITPEDRSIIKK